MKCIAHACWIALFWWLGLGYAGAQTLTQQAGPAASIVLSAAQASQSLGGQAEFWIDQTRLMRVHEIEAAGESLPWATHRDGRQYRIDGYALWLRFTAQPIDSRTPWYLTVQSSGIDAIQFFYRNAAGAWVVQEAGDSKPVSQWPLPGRIPAFALSTDTDHAVHYWVRIEHARVDYAAPLVLYSQGALLAAREREQFLLGAYFGLAALIAIVAAAHGIFFRSRTFAAYAVYVVTIALGQAAYLGVGAQHLWDTWLAWNRISTFLLPGISTVAALWFVKVVTEPARFSKALDVAVLALIGALALALVLDTLLIRRATFGLVMLLTTLGLVLVVVLIALVWRKGGDATIRLIALGFLPVIVFAAFPIARGLDLIPNSVLTRYGIAIGAAFEIPVLFYALSLRGNRRREAESRASALAGNDALTGLSHVRTLMPRLEEALQRARNLNHSCALLAISLPELDALASESGREVAEKALVVAASQLRRVATDVDTAARVGEHEFVLLIEGPTTASAATSRAQQLIAGGLRQSPGLPAGTLLRFHVTIAVLPHEDLDAATTLEWVLEGLRAMRLDSRKTIRPLNC